MRLPSWSRYFVTLSLLGSGVLYSAMIDSGDADAADRTPGYSAVDAAAFEINYLGGVLRVDGHAASMGHESALRRVIERTFAATDVSLRPLVASDDAWQPATLALLHTVSETEAANVSFVDDSVRIRAVVSDRAGWNASIRELEQALRPGIELRTSTVDVPAAVYDACRSAYRQLEASPVAFDRASAELRTTNYGVLDRHVEFAFDCDHLTITITGHTDGAGNEARNRELSLARANAVADYLVSRGVPRSQLITVGAGSSRPVANNDTAWGRMQNRRIEFTLVEREAASL
ncbi:MAG: OmpA family protein [Woeseiaceae bacterium]|nr:OmpA family protein [Woeseiaceae bacterium]